MRDRSVFLVMGDRALSSDTILSTSCLSLRRSSAWSRYRHRYAEYGNEVTILKLHDFVFELTYCWFTITGEIRDSTSLRHFFASDSLLPQFLICLFCRSWIALSRAGVKSWLTCCLVSESK